MRTLRRLGFDGPFSGGRHLFMVKGALKLHIPNPHHGELSPHLLSEILRQARIEPKDWNEVL